MIENNLKKIISSNLTHYRKLSGLTQAEVADMLNYSDKTVSKWERGDGLPDIIVLVKLAEFYGISVNDLVAEKQKKRLPNIRLKRILIPLLSVGIVWLVAFMLYIGIGLTVPSLKRLTMIFIVAIPISAIVLLVFTSIWHKNLLSCIFASIIVWTIPLIAYILLRHVNNSWLIFLIIVPLQALTILWYFYRQLIIDVWHHVGKKKSSKEDMD